MQRIKWIFIILLTSGLILFQMAFCQEQPPGTDIYSAEYSIEQNRLSLSDPVNLTKRAGYDNQPYFHPDGEYILYTSSRDEQTDIFRYDFTQKSISQITKTTESEYSPTVMPGGKFFSTIRVESDSRQRLWKFPIDGGSPTLVLNDVMPVGYHAWGNSNKVFMFILGNPPTLQIADVRTGKTETFVGNVGRSLHKIPGNNAVSFVHKISQEPWFITSISLINYEIDYLIKTIPGSEDYAWTPNGRIVMGNGAKLYEYMPGKTKHWHEIADFSSSGIKNISRIAVNPKGNQIVFVAEDGE